MKNKLKLVCGLIGTQIFAANLAIAAPVFGVPGPGYIPLECADGTMAYWVADPAINQTYAGAVAWCNYHHGGVKGQINSGSGIGVHGTVVTEAPIKDLHSSGQVIVDSNIVPPAPDMHPTDPLPPRPTPSLLCCQRPGQQTSLNLSTGAAVWTVRSPSNTTDAPTINSANAAWTTTVIPSAHWISPVGNPTTPGTFVYSTKFNAGECRVRCTINISGKFLVDNRGVLKVDGVTVASSVGTPMYGFLPGSVTPFSYNLPVVSGTHTITFEAFNQSGPTGADIQLLIKRLCAGRPGMPLQELSAGPAVNIVPTPANTVGGPGGGSSGCNPNNLPGNQNPC